MTTAPSALSPALRWTTNGVSLLSVLLFSGIIFGWAPLEMLLLEEGQYGELCSDRSLSSSSSPEEVVGRTPCAEQSDRLDAMFTVAQFALSFSSLPVGFALDSLPKSAHFAAAGIVESARKRVAFDAAGSRAPSIVITRTVFEAGSRRSRRTCFSRQSVASMAPPASSVPLGTAQLSNPTEQRASATHHHGLCRWGWMTPAKPSRAAALGVGGR